MAVDIYSPEPVTATTHRHPFIEERHVTFAKRRVVTGDRDALGQPVVISYDHRLSCCSRLVSSLAVGEVVEND